MPVQVVDLLEVVDVHDQEAELPAVAIEVLQAAAQGGIEHASVRQAGQIVGESIPPRPVGVFHGLDDRGGIREYLHAPDDLAGLVAHWSRSHADRLAVAAQVSKPDRDFAWLSVEHRRGQRAHGVAERPALVVNVGQDVVVAVSADDLGRRIAGDPFCPMVPIRELPFRVHVVDAVGHVVHDDLVQPVAECARGLGHRRWSRRSGRLEPWRRMRRGRRNGSIAASKASRDAGVHPRTLLRGSTKMAGDVGPCVGVNVAVSFPTARMRIW